MKRRDFITLAGTAVAWPLAARAQQPATPVIGFLRNTDAASSEQLVAAFRQGLAENGYVEGRNLTIEYRWADNHDDRLPSLIADLIRHNVAVIVAGGGTVVALPAIAATKTIPIVFELGGDPVKMGLVPSLSHPGGNVTGVALFANVVGPKRIELLHELVPKADVIGVLAYPNNPTAEGEVKQLQEAAPSFGIRLEVLNARTNDEIDLAFATLLQSKGGGLIVLANPLFVGRRDQLVALAARYAIPVIYPFPSFVKAGGLMSYGESLTEAFRQLGTYTARILKGEKPADLPVMQPTKLELMINLKTAKALGINVPPKVLAIADEVIE
jgi:putative tryptophan/tyrosine transport system substrate-binding protein